MKKRSTGDFFVLCGCIILVSFFALRHEPWRDEAQGWLLARDTSSLGQLLSYARYEGTPMLWHLILVPFAKLGFPYVTQTIINLFFISGAAAIFLFFSPFNRLVRYLFVFGYFMVFEYGVISRSYGLGILLLFGIAALYKKRLLHPYVYSALLLLLSQTHLYGYVISVGLSFIFFIEYAKTQTWILKKVFLIAGSMFCFLATVILLLPPSDLLIFAESRFTSAWHHAVTYNLSLLGVAFIPLQSFTLHFWNHSILYEYFWISVGIGLLLLLWLFSQSASKKTLVLFSCIFIPLFVLFILTGFGSLRHFGILYIASISFLWMADREESSDFLKKPGYALFQKYFFLGILGIQILSGAQALILGGTHAFSQSKNMALFLRTHHLSENNTFLMTHASAATASILPFVPDLFPAFFQLEYDRWGSFVIWNISYARGLAYSTGELMEKMNHAALQSNGRRIMLLSSVDHRQDPNFSKHYALLFHTDDAIVSNESYYLFEYTGSAK